MKHLCLISLTWAIVVVILAVPSYVLSSKQINYAIEQQKQLQQQLDIKKAELNLLNKLSGTGGVRPQSFSNSTTPGINSNL